MSEYSDRINVFVSSSSVSGVIIAAGTTTSAGFDCSVRAFKSLQVIASAISSGNGNFAVDTSNDNGTTWTPYLRLTRNLTNTNAQTDTRTHALTLTANGSDYLFFPPGDQFQLLRVKVGVTTDGSYSAFLSTQSA